MNEKTLEECIFCKIGRGEIPHNKVYEDDNFVAFLDIKPAARGHTLVIPKKHVVWMQEASDETVGEIFILAKKITLVLKKALLCDFVQVGVVGKDMPHFHVHLIPRYLNDALDVHHQIAQYKDGEEKSIVEKIKNGF